MKTKLEVVKIAKNLHKQYANVQQAMHDDLIVHGTKNSNNYKDKLNSISLCLKMLEGLEPSTQLEVEGSTKNEFYSFNLGYLVQVISTYKIAKKANLSFNDSMDIRNIDVKFCSLKSPSTDLSKVKELWTLLISNNGKTCLIKTQVLKSLLTTLPKQCYRLDRGQVRLTAYAIDYLPENQKYSWLVD